ncbi:ABC-type antimicrobial peptide transport system, ATPase component [Halobacteroides halobius DSM 5150]|uniref:ABC-type antimicrobial peptide transport system, ATPase component n=1 Tax=Halobacteroides halobius (strain ATCC 35273 / DSM 5150 / MD-1) TaxID=748449 RepID=L0K9W5_HALHC|nr:ABC transporter ATP-binding protein [Halobacteroides halobius]AGB41305.1 ABC-type antimicrobial peptide transport system, ATPase component [Halobacteroides halobius DSM 5150]
MLQVKNLSKKYHDGEEIAVEALKDISFNVQEGEMVAIMGPSGSGKSTLMHLIGCLDHPTSGKYILDGKEVTTANDKELAVIRNKRIGFVFQQFNLLSKTSVLHNVEVPLIYAGVSRKKRRDRARKLLQKVGLGHRLDHQPNEISGGQKQRVAIARALANNPSLILADEPTGNLDSKTEDQIIDILHQLHDQGHTIVLVTHSKKVGHNAERILHLLDGELIEDEVVV